MSLSLPVPPMRYIALLLFAIPVTGCAAFSYEPAGEQEFQGLPLAAAAIAMATTLNELRQSRTPVVVALRCQGDGTPMGAQSELSQRGRLERIHLVLSYSAAVAAARLA